MNIHHRAGTIDDVFLGNVCWARAHPYIATMTIDFESINQAVLRDVANGLHNGTAQLAPKSGAKDMSSLWAPK